jgi:hypothetical protein
MLNMLHKLTLFVCLWLVLSVLSACNSQYDARIAEANAYQARVQAAIVQAQENSRMYQTLAESAKPVYWPIVAIVIVAFLVFALLMRWHMVTVSHVAAGRPVQAAQLRILPNDPRFYPALRAEARRLGASVEVDGADYYIATACERVKVKALIEG